MKKKLIVRIISDHKFACKEHSRPVLDTLQFEKSPHGCVCIPRLLRSDGFEKSKHASVDRECR